MTKRENLFALLRGESITEVPVEFSLCPVLQEAYTQSTGSALPYAEYYGFPWRSVPAPDALPRPPFDERRYYPQGLLPGAYIDGWGVAHEPGSATAFHIDRKSVV